MSIVYQLPRYCLHSELVIIIAKVLFWDFRIAAMALLFYMIGKKSFRYLVEWCATDS